MLPSLAQQWQPIHHNQVIMSNIAPLPVSQRGLMYPNPMTMSNMMHISRVQPPEQQNSLHPDQLVKWDMSPPPIPHQQYNFPHRKYGVPLQQHGRLQEELRQLQPNQMTGPNLPPPVPHQQHSLSLSSRLAFRNSIACNTNQIKFSSPC
jgi:hypothetical protein